MKEKYLPIGSVVMLEGGSKRLMITGFCAISPEKKEEVYDYVGCLYPEGMFSSNQNALFNHEQIKQIYCLGYSDEEEKVFKNKLKDALSEANKSNNIDIEEL